MRVVVPNEVVEESAELALVPDQCPIEQLVADGCEPRPGEPTRQHRQDGPISRCEGGALDLVLQYQDLMAKSEDLCITLVTRHQQQSETSDQQPKQL